MNDITKPPPPPDLFTITLKLWKEREATTFHNSYLQRCDGEWVAVAGPALSFLYPTDSVEWISVNRGEV